MTKSKFCQPFYLSLSSAWRWLERRHWSTMCWRIGSVAMARVGPASLRSTGFRSKTCSSRTSSSASSTCWTTLWLRSSSNSTWKVASCHLKAGSHSSKTTRRGLPKSQRMMALRTTQLKPSRSGRIKWTKYSRSLIRLTASELKLTC